eukprot:2243866-Pyramimonas_sp.AAC.1
MPRRRPLCFYTATPALGRLLRLSTARLDDWLLIDRSNWGSAAAPPSGTSPGGRGSPGTARGWFIGRGGLCTTSKRADTAASLDRGC